jgi:hypothetical protein
MDEELRSLQRVYQGTGDQLAASKMILASMRAYNINGEIAAYLLENQDTFGEWDEHEIIYISWNSETGLIRIIVTAYNFYTYDQLRDNRPSPRLPEHMTPSQKYHYEEQLEDYLSQSLGQIQIFSFRAHIRDDLTWEDFEISHPWNPLDIYQETLRPNFFSSSVLGTPPQIPIPPQIEIFNTLHVERNLEGKVESLDEPPEINTEFGDRCEDYPCCGHDICPRRWTDGRQAEVICVCGASLPPNSRFSICDSCLKRPMEGDSPYDYDYPDYEEDEPDDDYSEDDYDEY